MSETVTEDKDQIRPWTLDDRLKDPRLLVKMELVITTIQEITKLFERLSEGRHMTKTESIPKLWETVKDLKVESLKELKSTFKTMSDRQQSHHDTTILKPTSTKNQKFVDR